MPGVIAVLGGTGAEGFGLALRWARAGESVIIGSRDAARAREAAAKIRAAVGSHATISGEENSAACAAADLVVLTIPFEGHSALLKQIKPAIPEGSIVVDTTVPLAASVGGRATRTLGLPELFVKPVGSAMQRVRAVIFGQGIFHAVEGEGGVGDPVGVAPDDGAEVGGVLQISVNFVVTEDNVAQVTILVRNSQRHNNAAVVDGAYFEAL